MTDFDDVDIPTIGKALAVILDTYYVDMCNVRTPVSVKFKNGSQIYIYNICCLPVTQHTVNI